MGQDKALLSHPRGGVWLTALVDQVRLLGLPLQVVSRHPAHADQLVDRPDVIVVQDPPPWQGPLQALGHVLAHGREPAAVPARAVDPEQR